ncbi:helix-turn-helix transcriptional regulator [Paenibacillus fonticola]|uniref:helix-turn-helix transcriptional regulator n=1 Tax=Paenibacillus fonticola TaxID=379896 RepID=UPI00037038DD|nr:helix-turn-helix transcriptional regulator [Paenibacillus fonticola]
MKLRDAREAAGYTQESLVYKINESMSCTLRNYQNIEYGVGIPSVTLALLICGILNIDAKDVDEWKLKAKN